MKGICQKWRHACCDVNFNLMTPPFRLGLCYSARDVCPMVHLSDFLSMPMSYVSAVRMIF